VPTIKQFEPKIKYIADAQATCKLCL